MSAYLMVSLQSEEFNKLKKDTVDKQKDLEKEMKKHPWWNEEKSWKNILNYLRLLMQPWSCFNLLKPWLVIFFKPKIVRSFWRLFSQINQFINSILEKIFSYNFCFSCS